MAELDVNKTGFDACYDELIALLERLHDLDSFTLDLSEDTSLMGKREKECFDELMKLAKDLASLTDETAKDVKLSKARYVLADQ